jgi:hypothetical protein
MRFRLQHLWQSQGNQGEHDGDQQGLERHTARLPPHLRQNRIVLDLL